MSNITTLKYSRLNHFNVSIEPYFIYFSAHTRNFFDGILLPGKSPVPHGSLKGICIYDVLYVIIL